ncbi:MAG: hypothetical protein ACE5FY_00345 [Nitrospiria bacterium]
MRRSRKPLFFSGLIGLLIVIGLVLFFGQPKPLPFPFAEPITYLPDYQPPGEGVTLYPTNGPFGIDTIETIAKTSESLFVGTFGGGLFRSNDHGDHWEPVNRGLLDKFIVDLTPIRKDLLFATTVRLGLFKSHDNGDHWTSSNKGLEQTDVESMVVLPDGQMLAGTGLGVYISQDEGATWNPFNQGLERELIRSIVVTEAQTIFAATQGQGIYKREPGGNQWIPVVRAFASEGLEERIIRALALGPGGTLFAGTMSSGIFRSSDGGETWGSANRGLGNKSIRTLATDEEGILYAGTGEGVYASEDNGMNWIFLSEGMRDFTIQSFVVTPEGDLYVGSVGEIYRGRRQLAWEPIHARILISPIQALDYGIEGITVGTNGKGTYVNAQDNWMSDNLGLVNLSIRDMDRGKSYLYAITNDGVYRRQPSRHRWDKTENLPDGEAISIGAGENDQVYIGATKGLFFSNSHGHNLEKITALGTNAVIDLDVEGLDVLATTATQIWMKSKEEAWQTIITKDGSPFLASELHPDGTVLALTAQGIWKRDLKGNWRELGGTLPKGLKMTSIAADPGNAKILYVGSDQGLFWSANEGEVWEDARFYHGLPFDGQINQVLPTNSTALWLATEENGVLIGISKVAQKSWFKRWVQ